MFTARKTHHDSAWCVTFAPTEKSLSSVLNFGALRDKRLFSRWPPALRPPVAIDTSASSVLLPQAIVDAYRAQQPARDGAPKWFQPRQSSTICGLSPLTLSVPELRPAPVGSPVQSRSRYWLSPHPRIRICGVSTSTRASASNCFCPTERLLPCSPSRV